MQEQINMLKKYNIEYTGADCECEEDYLKHAKDTDIIFYQGHTNITKRIMDSLPNLKAILIRGIGFDNFDLESAAKMGISISNTPGFCADEVSTHAVAFLLAFIRKINIYDNFIKKGKWKKKGQGYEGLESLKDENIGIIGFGYIGKMIAEKIHPFMANVFVFDPKAVIDEKRYFVKSVVLNDLLRSCKYIFIACPLTEDTKNLLDAPQLGLMRKDAVLINIARGKIVNEKELIQYLKEGKIAGALLDVFEEEPLLQNSPLLRFANVILSPHNASISQKSYEMSLKMSFDEIIRIATGQKLLYRIN